MPENVPVVNAATYLTLHYRLAVAGSENLVNTFGASPATLQLGSGQLAGALETCLLGMHEGERRLFTLPPEQAFGPRNPQLLRRVARSALDTASAASCQIGETIALNTPGGGRMAALVSDVGQEDVLLDFNHPLAGQTVEFEVAIVGIL